ncbi:LytR/AlgR family response regulator transcription factor [Bacillus solimangrovi]|uniref:DNA-binding response regulator n=1 Tax=Bacillus solimangrovi TaxID=1305675 RepID=A0A1E5LHV0_9BACI|nr:LytTR family DNA-binding domain-containing protein [Bacillus solimangrovi]OEH93647.1 DNA-binding response regulator [Bacillus solimangrovi]
MDKIKTIIIDDEVYSRDELKHLLSFYQFIEIVGQADSAEKGLKMIMNISPDVVFVDIEMGYMTGIELADTLQKLKQPPKVVFATAHPDYAVKAFRLEAVDYLLKPFDEDELEETVKRLENHFNQINTTLHLEKTLGKLAVEEGERIHYITPEEILYMSVEQRETKLYTKEKIYNTRMTLKELEDKLSSYSFFRTHKSFLVNLQKIEQLIPWFNGAYQIKVEDRIEEIPVSRNYAKSLRKRLEI